ncbi:MAG: hypothetical protein B7Z47_07505 [Chthoniobacter sp. 12-60-6]|nr:MAG: hypothetical protein B7Z47_07505 [Chthoniobacter sp. 12-60-6]
MKSPMNLSTLTLLALLFAGSCGGVFGQVVNLILLPKREATIYDYVDKLPAEKKNAIAVIEGDQSGGTGFFARFNDTVYLVTNLHVLYGNSTFKATISSGAEVKIAGMLAAREADIALLKLTEEPKAYFDVQISVETKHKAGDAILVPGNSLGGGTILQTEGKIAGIGPAKIEHNAPTFRGNSGSPILSVDTWKVLGVDTMSVSVDRSCFADDSSLMRRSSQVKSDVRLFGYRLDSVSQWEPIDWKRFVQQAKTVEEADSQITGIVAVFNGDVTQWRRHPPTNAIMRELEELINKPRISAVNIDNKKESISVNFRNMLKKIEQDALDSTRTGYGYISQKYQPLALRAKAVREWSEARKVR